MVTNAARHSQVKLVRCVCARPSVIHEWRRPQSQELSQEQEHKCSTNALLHVESLFVHVSYMYSRLRNKTRYNRFHDLSKRNMYAQSCDINSRKSVWYAYTGAWL